MHHILYTYGARISRVLLTSVVYNCARREENDEVEKYSTGILDEFNKFDLFWTGVYEWYLPRWALHSGRVHLGRYHSFT